MALQSLLPSTITFDYLWTVFPPDCLIVEKDPLAGTSILRAISAQQQRTKDGLVVFAITAEHVDWNGKRLGIVKQKLKIDDFSGTLAMADLPYVPLQYHPHRNNVIQRVLERAQKKFAYCKPGFQIREHEGPGLTSSRALHYVSGVEAAEIDRGSQVYFPLTDINTRQFQGRIMVDPRKMHQLEPKSAMALSLHKFRKSSRTWLSDLETDKRVIMSPRYDFRRDTDNLPPIQKILDELLGAYDEANTDNNDDANVSDIDLFYMNDSDSDSDSSQSVTQDWSQERIETPTKSLTDEEMLLLSGRVLGYCLNDAAWGQCFPAPPPPLFRPAHRHL